MLIAKSLACSLSIDLGLVVSVISDVLGVELMRGGPTSRACHGNPDLEVWVGPQDTARLVALTEDGEAFLDLMRE